MATTRISARSLTPKLVLVTAWLRQVGSRSPAHSALGSRDPRTSPFPSRDARDELRVRPRSCFRAPSRRTPPPLGLRTHASHPSTLALCPGPGPSPSPPPLPRRSGSSARAAAVPGIWEEAEGGAGPAWRGRGASLLGAATETKSNQSNRKRPAMAPGVPVRHLSPGRRRPARDDSPAW